MTPFDIILQLFASQGGQAAAGSQSAGAAGASPMPGMSQAPTQGGFSQKPKPAPQVNLVRGPLSGSNMRLLR